MSSAQEDKKKKLQELRDRKKQREAETQILKETDHKKNFGEVDNLVNNLLENKTSPLPSEKKIETTSEEKPQEVKPARKWKLTYDSFVGDQKYEPKIEYFDAEVQCNFENLDIKKSQDNVYIPQKDNNEPKKSMAPQSNEIAQDNKKRISTVYEKPEMTQEDIHTIMKSNTFMDFFDRSSKMIEKSLDNKQFADIDTIISQEVQAGDEDSTDLLTHDLKFYDSQYSAKRVITALEMSKNIPDFLLAGYSQNEEGNINDPVGVVLLWSLALKNRPEKHLFCQSPVTSACFHPFSNNMIIGGLYNGQIVIWDLRNKQLPIQRTTLSNEGHTYPIYSLKVVGSQNAHNIVSISNDGKLCMWNINNLTKPIKVLQIPNCNTTVMTFPSGDDNNFYVGGEEGSIYQQQLHQETNQKQDEALHSFQDGHSAAITSLSANNSQFQAEYSHLLNGLLLSSSFDWTVKLWSPKNTTKCLWTFETAEDYIYDVSWNPSNPTLFAAVDGEGYIDLWDLTEDFEMPRYHYTHDNYAINKCMWNLDGTKLFTGDSQGYINCFGLDKKALRFNTDKLEEIENLIESIKKVE